MPWVNVPISSIHQRKTERVGADRDRGRSGLWLETWYCRSPSARCPTDPPSGRNGSRNDRPPPAQRLDRAASGSTTDRPPSRDAQWYPDSGPQNRRRGESKESTNEPVNGESRRSFFSISNCRHGPKSKSSNRTETGKTIRPPRITMMAGRGAELRKRLRTNGTYPGHMRAIQSFLSLGSSAFLVCFRVEATCRSSIIRHSQKETCRASALIDTIIEPQWGQPSGSDWRQMIHRGIRMRSASTGRGFIPAISVSCVRH